MGENFLQKAIGIVDPGGDPGAIDGAAAACDTLAGSLEQTMSHLDSVVQGLKGDWSGSASAAFSRKWTAFKSEVGKYPPDLRQAAQGLRKVAAAIRKAQADAHKLEETAVVTGAVALVLTPFTGGGSDAVEAGAVGAEAAGIMATLGAELADVAASFGTVLLRMGMGMALTFGSDVFTKAAVQHVNPLNLDNWSADDLSGILIGGDTTAVLIGAGSIPAIDNLTQSTALTQSGWLEKMISGAAFGVVGGGAGGAATQFALNGEPVTSPQAWKTIGIDAGLGAAAGAGAGYAFGRMPSDLTGAWGKMSGMFRDPGSSLTPAGGADAPGAAPTGSANPFEVLGVTPRPDYTDADLKAFYRRAAKQTHSDATLSGNDEPFIDITRAYEQLRAPGGVARAYAASTGRAAAPATAAPATAAPGSAAPGSAPAAHSEPSPGAPAGQDRAAPATGGGLVGPHGRPVDMSTGTERPPVPGGPLIRRALPGAAAARPALPAAVGVSGFAGSHAWAQIPAHHPSTPEQRAVKLNFWQGVAKIPVSGLQHKLTVHDHKPATGPGSQPPPTRGQAPVPLLRHPAPHPAPTHATPYTVRGGESLWDIARGDPARLRAIERANPQITNPDDIQPGQVVHVPAAAGR